MSMTFTSAHPFSTIFKLTSVQQIDVLAGPQGTLFGRNTTGGVIQIRTLDPSHDLTLNASLTYGNYDTVAVPVYASVGLSDTVATDLSFLYENRGKGMGRNLFLGTDTYRRTDNNVSVRNKWLLELAPTTKVRLAFRLYVRGEQPRLSEGTGHILPAGQRAVRRARLPWSSQFAV